jgi:hypothetical protein
LSPLTIVMFSLTLSKHAAIGRRTGLSLISPDGNTLCDRLEGCPKTLLAQNPYFRVCRNRNKFACPKVRVWRLKKSSLWAFERYLVLAYLVRVGMSGVATRGTTFVREGLEKLFGWEHVFRWER